MTYAKTMREDAARVAMQMQAIHDKVKLENRPMSTDEVASWDKLADTHNAYEDSIKRAERMDDISSHLKSTTTATGQPAFALTPEGIEMAQDTMRLGKNAKKAQTPRDKAFAKYLRTADNSALSREEHQLLAMNPHTDFGADGNPMQFRNTMSTTTGTQGGNIVPTGFSDMLEEAMKWFGGIEGNVQVMKTETGQPIPYPTVNDTNEKGAIISQNVQMSQQDLGQTSPATGFGFVTLNAYIGTSKLVLIPLALVEDAYFNLDALTARLLGTRLGRLYNWKCTTGSGTNEPTGIITAVVAVPSSACVNTLAPGSTVTISYSQLVDMEHFVDPAYRDNAKWMFSDTFLKILKKLVDSTGRPLWQPGLTASFRNGAAVDLIAAKPMILDHPYIINNEIAVPAANAYSCLFGDFTKFVVRELNSGTTLIRFQERYMDYLQMGYTAFRRFDSNLLDAGTHPIGVMQQSAS